jgi:hypothetical protein
MIFERRINLLFVGERGAGLAASLSWFDRYIMYVSKVIGSNRGELFPA